eukprot:CAMPEP_0206214306 /NCGR_PEP_ID=MMETSP0047_2-20121206/1595_1 /ASSEMBLY_ACC=CAM_ASM_000192 /TAXON_ID=195065 /ORGANISM="Chroomonas mesostigmatica_cf, Strain CCMP1168" /LENGTH=119 /DNA_ID=CAMNT_0053636533 /DNA_START=118 /DNA_END=477 /DNA_ORIENTATION=-
MLPQKANRAGKALKDRRPKALKDRRPKALPAKAHKNINPTPPGLSLLSSLVLQQGRVGGHKGGGCTPSALPPPPGPLIQDSSMGGAPLASLLSSLACLFCFTSHRRQYQLPFGALLSGG